MTGTEISWTSVMTSVQRWKIWAWWSVPSSSVSSLRSCPEEKTPPFADKTITLSSESTFWSRFDLIASSIFKERAFLRFGLFSTILLMPSSWLQIVRLSSFVWLRNLLLNWRAARESYQKSNYKLKIFIAWQLMTAKHKLTIMHRNQWQVIKFI